MLAASLYRHCFLSIVPDSLKWWPLHWLARRRRPLVGLRWPSTLSIPSLLLCILGHKNGKSDQNSQKSQIFIEILLKIFFFFKGLITNYELVMVQVHSTESTKELGYNCNLSAGDFDSFFLKYFGVENPDPSQLLH